MKLERSGPQHTVFGPLAVGPQAALPQVPPVSAHLAVPAAELGRDFAFDPDQ
jgi:hypothetical protein